MARLSALSLATWERAAAASGLLNLAIGQPARSLLPLRAVQEASQQAFSELDGRYLLQYGAPAGSEHYLSAVASFLEAHREHQCERSQLFATSGNSGGLTLITRVLTRPGDTILMEEPSYFLAHKIFKDHYCNFLPASQSIEGSGTIDVDALTRSLWQQRYLTTAVADHPFPKLLYCVPTGNNPTGRTMPDHDRARLVGLCAEHGIRIIADDVYELLQWKMTEAPKALRWHAQQQGVPGTVVSLGSWSKILGPGLRLGWVEAEQEVMQMLADDGEVDSGSFTSPFVESVVAMMIQNGSAQTHLIALREALERRAQLLSNAVNEQLPQGAVGVVHNAAAGYFLWVDLQGIDATALKSRCETDHGVSFLPGSRCALLGSSATHCRICFAFLEEDMLVEAGRRLGAALAAALREASA